MFRAIKRAYCHIPSYGQVMLRKGLKQLGWYKDTEEEKYFSLMLKGERKGWFGSSTFYLVLTEKCLEESAKRGDINLKYLKNPAIPFGQYTGIQHIENAGRLKNTFDAVFLHVFKYVKGGEIEEKIIAMSERQFRRAITRAKSHPELVIRRHIWDGFIRLLYRCTHFRKK